MDEILIEHDGDVEILTLNRPEARNALSAEMVAELTTELRAAGDNPDVRGVTLRGEGPVFCAGGDLKGFQSIFQAGNDEHAVAKKVEKRAANDLRFGEIIRPVNQSGAHKFRLIGEVGVAKRRLHFRHPGPIE